MNVTSGFLRVIPPETVIRPRRLLAVLALLPLLLGYAGTLRAQNLEVFTSPIDVTGLPLVMRFSAPNRETGRLVDIPVPPGFFGPKFSRLLGASLNAQFDNFWSGALDAQGNTARTLACDDPNTGIKAKVAIEVAKQGNQAHDVSCDLASNGEMLVQQIGSTLILAYLLRNNSVTFQSTSEFTCSPANGSVFCPNDPRFTVKFAIEIVTVLRAGGICELFGDDGQVFVQGASFESQNAAALIGRFFAGQKFVAAERALNETVRRQALPIDSALQELRTGDLCAKRLPNADRILFAFRDFETEVDLRRGIVLHATHAGILAPVVSVAQPGPPAPSFFRPMISTEQPLIKAGNSVLLHGQHFPIAIDLATQLPVGLEHDNRNPSIILGAPRGGVCFNGGGTDLEFGPVGGALRTEHLAATLQGECSAGIDVKPLTPSTSYQFRARDCDSFTCSPWSLIVHASTTRVIRAPDTVILELDRQVPLDGARIDGNGNFDLPITIPAGTTPGAHTIRAAMLGGVAAEVVVQVAAPGGGTQASIMIVGLLQGETGCPNHPVTSTQTDDTFQLFGAGFAAGSVVVNLDSADGVQLGTAAVRPDGTFCRPMRSPTAANAGPHSIVAVQGGAIVARTNVTFVVPSVLH